MRRSPFLGHLAALFVIGVLPTAATAAEPAWIGAEYERRGGARGFLLTVDAREAASLDQPGSSWRRTGAIVQAYGSPEGAFSIPVCRVSAGETRGYAIGEPRCAQYAGYVPGQAPTPEVFFLAKADASGACASGEPAWVLAHPTDSALVARIGVAEPVPGMGIAKSALLWGLCAPKTARMRRIEAARFLDQATFGATSASIDALVNGAGVRAWIAEQMAMPATRYTQYPTYFYYPAGVVDVNCTFNLPDGTWASPEAQRCARETFSPILVTREFYVQAAEGKDQLRQRVAWAWSQLFVVTSVKFGWAYGMADYQQKLRDGAFTRFEDLLYMMATHPMMGRMLDNMGNGKASGDRAPNENFARELLQLFTTGTIRLNPDGSPVLTANGLPVPVYPQETVMELARAMTGWGSALTPAPPPGRIPGNFRDPMVPISGQHDLGSKTMFGGELFIPAGLDPDVAMRRIMKFLAEHPNTAIFISRYLIQRLVTSNPSGAYLERISGVFRNNGKGVVGDMGAVITAILLDPEARGAIRPEVDYGRMRDSPQRWVGLQRAVNTKGFSADENRLLDELESNPFSAPSVFGYFLADFEVAPGLYGAEFQINRASTVLGWASLVSFMSQSSLQGRTPAVNGTSDISEYVAMAGDVGKLVDHLNLTFTAGGMSSATASAITELAGSVRNKGPEYVARTALFLLFNSSQYHVQR